MFTEGARFTVVFTLSSGLILVKASWARCGNSAARGAVVTSWTNSARWSLHWSSSVGSLQTVETFEERL